MFRKGDRIEFTHPKTKTATLGVITKGGATTVQFVSDEGQGFKGNPAHLKRSTAPLPAGQRTIPTLSKGDRTEYDDAGTLRYGTVTKGGKNVQVVLDGGAYTVTGPASAFKVSDNPLPKDAPHPMDDWDVVGYKEFSRMSQETTAFDATVTYKGEPVLHAQNSGTGGCNTYYRTPTAPALADRKLEEDAKQWALDHGLEDGGFFEAADTWLNWKTTQAPYGVTAKDFFEKWNRSMAEMTGDSTWKP